MLDCSSCVCVSERTATGTVLARDGGTEGTWPYHRSNPWRLSRCRAASSHSSYDCAFRSKSSHSSTGFLLEYQLQSFCVTGADASEVLSPSNRARAGGRGRPTAYTHPLPKLEHIHGNSPDGQDSAHDGCRGSAGSRYDPRKAERSADRPARIATGCLYGWRRPVSGCIMSAVD